jgi:hydrogenase maturation protease
VRLCPRARGDILDQVLAGRTAVIEGLDEGLDGIIHVGVTIEEDPGRDLGEGRYPGHRFFFGLDEVEPIDDGLSADARRPRILVAGIGNIFLADDGFGVAVSQQLAMRPSRAGVDVRDFGIRGMDLAYAMQRDYDVVILIDAAQRGETPGTLSIIDARVDAEGDAVVDTHGMDPVKVLALARALGRVPPRVLVLACEPERVLSSEQWDDMSMTMSDVVTQAVAEAVTVSETLIDRLIAEVTALDASSRAAYTSADTSNTPGEITHGQQHGN